MTWPLWCRWRDKPIRYGIGSAPLTVCNDCFEILDRLDALMGRTSRKGPRRDRLRQRQPGLPDPR